MNEVPAALLKRIESNDGEEFEHKSEYPERQIEPFKVRKAQEGDFVAYWATLADGNKRQAIFKHSGSEDDDLAALYTLETQQGEALCAINGHPEELIEEVDSAKFCLRCEATL